MLLNANTFTLLVHPVTVVYVDPVTAAQTAVPYCQMTAPVLADFEQEPGMFEAEGARFNLWAANLGAVVPVKGGSVVGPDARRWHVEKSTVCSHGASYALDCTLERNP